MAAAQGSDYEMWTRFVEANYLIDAKTYEGKCPTCDSPRDCNNYFCLQCKLGGLCPITFRGNGEHAGHRWLQVRRQSHKSAVDPEELAKYLPRESTKHIQKSLLNTGSLCYLRTDHQISTSSRVPTKRAKTSSRWQPSLRKSCEACNKVIANSQDCKEDFLLCSVECLIMLAQRQPGRNLLRMLDGALAPTNEFPRTALEKIKGMLPGSSSKPCSKTLAVIDGRSGTSSGGGKVAEEPPAVRDSSGLRTSYENSVRKDDMVDFLDTSAVQVFCSNDHTVHHLRTRKVSTAQANVVYCEGCREKVANAKSYRYRDENARNARVCSIDCWLVYRARHRPMNGPVNRPVNFRNGHARKQGTPMRSPQK